MRPPLVGIIILNWNGWRDTLACVESCRNLNWPNYSIVIVDNGSSDGSEEILRQNLKNVEIVQAGANLGFAGGCNVGILHAIDRGADYVWLLNNDAVAGPESLTRLVEALEKDAAAGIAGSKIYYHDDPDRIWSAGGMWEKGRLRLRQRGANQLDGREFCEVRKVGSVSGCSMLVRAATIRKVGLLNEGYFLYWEDTEWCSRVREKEDAVLFVPASHVWHKVSSTVAAHSEPQYYYFTRNGLLFCRHHDLLSLPVFLAYVTADVVVGRFRGNQAMLRGFRRGIADFLLGRMGRREFP